MITKSKTKRELRETSFDRGKVRPVVILIENGIARAKLKGTRDPWRVISIAGALQSAIKRDIT